MDEIYLERLGELVDVCENYIAAGFLPGMPADIQLRTLNEAMPRLRDEIKEIFFALGGDPETWD